MEAGAGIRSTGRGRGAGNLDAKGVGSLDAKGAGCVASIVVTARAGGARWREPRDRLAAMTGQRRGGFGVMWGVCACCTLYMTPYIADIARFKARTAL